MREGAYADVANLWVEAGKVGNNAFRNNKDTVD